MKTSALIVLLAAWASANSLASSCASQCVERIADGCDQNNFACHCALPGLIKQLEPCMQSTCSDAEALSEAKAAFTSQCKSAGFKVNFSEESPVHLDMARRAEASMASMAGMAGMSMNAAPAPTAAGGAAAYKSAAGGAARATTTRANRPASFTGAASPRNVAGSMVGLVAAVAAAAAI